MYAVLWCVEMELTLAAPAAAAAATVAQYRGLLADWGLASGSLPGLVPVRDLLETLYSR